MLSARQGTSVAPLICLRGVRYSVGRPRYRTHSSCRGIIRSAAASAKASDSALRAAQSETSDLERLILLPASLDDQRSKVATLVYFSGTDGTGQAITPQLPGLSAAGFDVQCLYMPVTNRSSWQSLTATAVELLKEYLATSPQSQVTLVGESFGGCLALRVALEAPELIANLALVNPATCFQSSLGGLSSLVAATNLLSVFPKPLFETAQAVLVPFLVDRERVAPVTTRAVQALMLMTAPVSAQITSGALKGSSTAQQLEAEAAGGRYVPSATASWRLNLLRSGNLADVQLATIRVPTLVIASACDRLMPSLGEAARLVSLMPHARRLTLPNSGHTALLEEGVDLAVLLDRAGFLPPGRTASPRNLKTQQQISTHFRSSNLRSQTGATFPAGAAVVKEQVGVPIISTLDDLATLSTASAAAVSDVSAAYAPLAEITPSAAQSSEDSSSSNLSRIRTRRRSPAMATMEQTQPPWTRTTHTSAEMIDQYDDNSAVSPLKTASETLAAAAAAVENPVRNPSSAPDASTQPPRSLQSGDNIRQLGSINDVMQPRAGASAGFGHKRQRSDQQKSAAGPGNSPAWTRPNANIERAMGQLAGWRALVSPRVFGSSNLPDPLRPVQQPLLFVGNHTRFGLFDLPPLIMELYSRGIFVRGLADPRHWLGPIGTVFASFGAVKAGALTTARLLREKQGVLLFPGGGREVMKRRGEDYQLFWKDRTDFVRLAAKYDALIIPFSAVGADDAFNVFMDTDELLANPITGPLARSAVAALDASLDPVDTVAPLTTLPGTNLPSLLPLPDLRQRLYFRFFEPVDCSDVSPSDSEECGRIYDGVRNTILNGMASLQRERAADTGRSLGSRLRAIGARVFPAFDLMGENDTTKL